MSLKIDKNELVAFMSGFDQAQYPLLNGDEVIYAAGMQPLKDIIGDTPFVPVLEIRQKGVVYEARFTRHTSSVPVWGSQELEGIQTVSDVLALHAYLTKTGQLNPEKDGVWQLPAIRSQDLFDGSPEEMRLDTVILKGSVQIGLCSIAPTRQRVYRAEPLGQYDGRNGI